MHTSSRRHQMMMAQKGMWQPTCPFLNATMLGDVQRTSFSTMACSIARSIDVVGEPWTPLIVRDLWLGRHKFDDIQRNLNISRKVLTERLKTLVEAGVVERRPYQRDPERYEYLLTIKVRN
jgi:DNA-binding HxlR family transcriptional regulator